MNAYDKEGCSEIFLLVEIFNSLFQEICHWLFYTFQLLMFEYFFSV